jgi:hypothetical protein
VRVHDTHAPVDRRYRRDTPEPAEPTIGSARPTRSGRRDSSAQRPSRGSRSTSGGELTSWVSSPRRRQSLLGSSEAGLRAVLGLTSETPMSIYRSLTRRQGSHDVCAPIRPASSSLCGHGQRRSCPVSRERRSIC